MGLGIGQQEPSLEGAQIGKSGQFQIVRRLSAGGMGTVYEGLDQSAGRRVAVKVLHRDIAQHRDVTLRFINEARALNVLHHPNLVRVMHLGKLPSGMPYLVMEYLDGVSLTAFLRENSGRLSVKQAIAICSQAASALIAAHEKGIIHRDIKPDNIMVMAGARPEDRPLVKVFDFGIAKLPPEHMSVELTVLRTQTGQLLGTPYYMAPEQCRGDATHTEKVDVYALGTVLFDCLAGRTPFITVARGDAAMMHICAQQIAEPAPPLSEFVPDAPPQLVALVARLLAKSPGERPSMRELHEQLTGLDRVGQSEPLVSALARAPGAASPASVETATVIQREPRAPVSRTAAKGRSLVPYLIAAGVVVWFVILALWALG